MFLHERVRETEGGTGCGLSVADVGKAAQEDAAAPSSAPVLYSEQILKVGSSREMIKKFPL